MKEFKTFTPVDIEEYKIEDVLTLLEDRKDSVLPSKRVRLNYVKMLYDVLGLDLSPDIALASAADADAVLILAVAGGGKTTWAQVMAILQKLIRPARNENGKIRGSNILSLVYNRHNVADMKNRHKQLVQRLMSARIKGLDIDDEINACTLHSFCEFWRKRYVAQMNLFGSTLLSEEESLRYMRRALIVAGKTKKEVDFSQIDEAKVLSLYQYYKESMCTISDLENNDKFSDLNVQLSVVEYVFERYEAVKARSRKYDFTDMLWKFFNLLRTDADVLAEVQSYYEYVIADEVQDFTPLMWSILKLLVSGGIPLTCIGDEDQNIYRFRGADISSLLYFTDNFSGGRVYSLVQNRRCGKEILEYSKRVVSKNRLRFNKSVQGLHSGGSVNFVAYKSVTGQLINVVKELEKKTPDELHETCVCYRDSVCSELLVDLLEEKGIPFHVIRGKQPLSHELYRHVTDVMNILSMPCDRKILLNLYKVLPCSRDKIYHVFGYSAEKRSFTKDDDDKIHFSQYYYGDLINVNGFVDAMDILMQLSSKVDRVPMSEIFPKVFEMLDKYYWHYKKSNNTDQEMDELFEERVKKFFCSDKKYVDLVAELGKRRSICSKNTSIGAGAAIATFHSLKGLEFDCVYAIFLNNDVFPNFPLIESRGYPAYIEQELKESETRLWYVAVTRAKKQFNAYYSADNPSLFVAEELDLQGGGNEFFIDSRIYDSEKFKEYEPPIAEEKSAIDLFIDDFDLDFVPENAEKEEMPKEDNRLEEPDRVVAASKNAYMERLLCSL